MIFEKWLIPDKIFSSFTDVTPEMLRELGIRYIFSDIDNTLATYDDSVPPPETEKWLGKVRDKGISVIIVSNNDRGRVEKFANAAGLPCYWKAAKPATKVLRQAMSDAGAKPENSLLFGDQLLTDAAAGRRLGMRVFIVPPIRDKRSVFFRFKRRIEKPYLKKYHKTKKERKGDL